MGAPLSWPVVVIGQPVLTCWISVYKVLTGRTASAMTRDCTGHSEKQANTCPASKTSQASTKSQPEACLETSTRLPGAENAGAGGALL